LIIAFLAIIAIALAVESHADQRQQFLEFQQEYQRVYKTNAEFEYRFGVFQENLKRAAELQLKNPLATFGVNKFSDFTKEEFEGTYLMPNVDVSTWVKPPPKDFSIEHPLNNLGCVPNPTWYSWIDCNVLTNIYDQGQCGSCWAFSATETIESYVALSGGGLNSLSMEPIVDCDTTDGGCQGGSPTRAYQYVQNAGGIESYNDYPYTAGNGYSSNCQFNSGDVAATISSWNSLSGGEEGLYQQLSSSSGGPISVCVDASTWSSYTGGILTECPDQIDHCVQLIGYKNYNENGAFWIVRNSWGTNWGIGGYIWIAIGDDLCGIGDWGSIVSANSA